jgi:hypothetical protein
MGRFQLNIWLLEWIPLLSVPIVALTAAQRLKITAEVALPPAFAFTVAGAAAQLSQIIVGNDRPNWGSSGAAAPLGWALLAAALTGAVMGGTASMRRIRHTLLAGGAALAYLCCVALVDTLRGAIAPAAGPATGRNELALLMAWLVIAMWTPRLLEAGRVAPVYLGAVWGLAAFGVAYHG